VILASNTSSISITRIGAATERPGQVIGMHFMNPVHVMKLVEVIKGLRTDEATISTTVSLAEDLSKVCVEARDIAGFAVNRILMPMINEAFYTLYEGIASPEGIDTAMKLGTNQPMGPLQLADFIGLDTCLAIMEVLHDGLGDGKYRPCPLLKNYVLAGDLGQKTGRGVYIYEGGR
jgi:3-hydroxybutyryl-CoA dehydrogenase